MFGHWYDSTPKKSRRKRDSNPGSFALEADALPLGQQGGKEREREREGGGRERGRERERERESELLTQTNRKTSDGM